VTTRRGAAATWRGLITRRGTTENPIQAVAAGYPRESSAHERGCALARQRIDVRDPHVRARAWRLLAARGFPEDVIADVVPDGD
jgi:SOS response regulatory protein OraA/RecX